MIIDAVALLDAHKKRFHLVEAEINKREILAETLEKIVGLALDFTRENPKEEVLNTVVDIIENTLVLVRLEEEESYFTTDINEHIWFSVDCLNRQRERESDRVVARDFLVESATDIFSAGHRPSFTFIEVVAFSIAQMGLSKEEIVECYLNRTSLITK